MSDDRHDAIRTRAYQLWEDEGRPHGRDADHWHAASQGDDGTPAAGDGAAAGSEGGDLTEQLPAGSPPARKMRAAPAKAAVRDQAKAAPQTVAAEPGAKSRKAKTKATK